MPKRRGRQTDLFGSTLPMVLIAIGAILYLQGNTDFGFTIMVLAILVMVLSLGTRR